MLDLGEFIVKKKTANKEQSACYRKLTLFVANYGHVFDFGSTEINWSAVHRE